MAEGTATGSEGTKYRYTNAASAPPTSGATMNSHTCDSALCPTMTAGARLRAGLTDVPVSGMPIKCTIVRATPIARPAGPGEPTRLVATSTTVTKMKVSTTSVANAPAETDDPASLNPKLSVATPTPTNTSRAVPRASATSLRCVISDLLCPACDPVPDANRRPRRKLLWFVKRCDGRHPRYTFASPPIKTIGCGLAGTGTVLAALGGRRIGLPATLSPQG